MNYCELTKELIKIDGYLFALRKTTDVPVIISDKNGYVVASIDTFDNKFLYVTEFVDKKVLIDRWKEISNLSKRNLKLNHKYNFYEIELPWVMVEEE